MAKTKRSEYVDITQNRHRGNKNSQKANIAVAPRKKKVRDQLLEWWKGRIATRQDAADHFKDPAFFQKPIEYNTITARISEMVKNGALVEVGKGTTRSGCDAALLVLAEERHLFEKKEPEKPAEPEKPKEPEGGEGQGNLF